MWVCGYVSMWVCMYVCVRVYNLSGITNTNKQIIHAQISCEFENFILYFTAKFKKTLRKNILIKSETKYIYNCHILNVF